MVLQAISDQRHVSVDGKLVSTFVLLAASPESGLDSRGAHWRYNAADSEAIWCGAGLYRGELEL